MGLEPVESCLQNGLERHACDFNDLDLAATWAADREGGVHEKGVGKERRAGYPGRAKTAVKQPRPAAYT